MLVSLVCLLHCADVKQVLVVDRERQETGSKCSFTKHYDGQGLFCLDHV